MKMFMSLLLLLSILNIYTMERRASSLQAVGVSPWEMAGVSRTWEKGVPVSFVASDERTGGLGMEYSDGYIRTCHKKKCPERMS